MPHAVEVGETLLHLFHFLLVNPLQEEGCLSLDLDDSFSLILIVDSSPPLGFQAVPPLLNDRDFIKHLLDLPNANRPIPSLLVRHLFSPPALQAFRCLQLDCTDYNLVLLPKQFTYRHCRNFVQVHMLSALLH